MHNVAQFVCVPCNESVMFLTLGSHHNLVPHPTPPQTA